MRIGTRWGRWVWIIVVAILLVWGFTQVKAEKKSDLRSTLTLAYSHSLRPCHNSFSPAC